MVFSTPLLLVVLFTAPPLQIQQRLLSSSATSNLRLEAGIPQPIDPSGWPERFPAKDHCSKCGLCETSFVQHVATACAFLGDGMSRIDDAEITVHGRQRHSDLQQHGHTNDRARTTHMTAKVADESRFGVLYEPVQLARGMTIPDAQWTGIVTAICLSMLEHGLVDAVICVAGATTAADGDNNNERPWSSPDPIIAKTSKDILRGRGVKPALAPSLKVMDQVRADPSIRKLLFCGVGCAVQAFRAIPVDFLDEVYVLGTNCADNSPTPEAAQNFVANGVLGGNTSSKDSPTSSLPKIRGYEFMQDFRVHVKADDDLYVKKPYFVLPGTIAQSSIAKSCLACFDYTNGLADVVVGYMGAPYESKNRMDQSLQTVTIRNERGRVMVDTALQSRRLQLCGVATGSGQHERIATATTLSDTIVQDMIGGTVPASGMPLWLGEIMATLLTTIGPKGIAFARYSIDYHILRNYLHVLYEWGPDRAQQHLPQYARKIVQHYKTTDASFAKLCQKVSMSSSFKKMGS